MRSKARCIEIKSIGEACKEMERIGVDPAGIALMAEKQIHHNLKLAGLTPAEANIIKQDALSVGAEAAVARGVVSCEIKESDCIISGTLKQIKRLAEKLKLQPYGLPEAAKSIESLLNNLYQPSIIFKSRTHSWDLSKKTLVMGILNVTPDSFYDRGRYFDADKAIERGMLMVEEGADIIDVGGESTRPGAREVNEDEELKRVIPVVEALAEKDIVISVDTTKASVAREALNAGAEIINDISALKKDAEMPEVVGSFGVGVIVMHMRGTPSTMMEHTEYRDLMGEIFDYLSERLHYAVSTGLEMEKIAIDPGIGFAKTPNANLEIIRRLGELKALGRPILAGASRKSFIGDVLGVPAAERLIGTLSAVSASVLNGANIIRTHDVRDSRDAVKMIEAIKKGLERGLAHA